MNWVNSCNGSATTTTPWTVSSVPSFDGIALVQTIPPIATHCSVARSVCLSHSCTLLKQSDEFRCHLAGTPVGSDDTLLDGVPDAPGEIWGCWTPAKTCNCIVAATTWRIPTKSDSACYQISLVLVITYYLCRKRFCFRICLFVPRITEKVMNGFGQNFTDGFGMAKEGSNWILLAIQINLWILGHLEFFTNRRRKP